jgi:MFS family permease
MPVFSDQILHGGARGLGILMGASGCGALVGALLLASRKRLAGLGTWVVVAAGVFGASLIAFSLSRSFVLSVVLLVPVGGAMMLQLSASNTLIQAMTPDAMRGRVMALYTMMFMGTAPLGALLAGALANRIGAPLTVAGGGACCVVAAIVFGRLLPKLRGVAREIILGMPTAAGTPDGASMPPPAPVAAT